MREQQAKILRRESTISMIQSLAWTSRSGAATDALLRAAQGTAQTPAEVLLRPSRGEE